MNDNSKTTLMCGTANCTFTSLVSSYNHLHAMHNTNKTTLVCGTANCIRSHCLLGHISPSSCALIWYKAQQTNSIWYNYLFHSCFFLFYWTTNQYLLCVSLRYIWKCAKQCGKIESIFRMFIKMHFIFHYGEIKKVVYIYIGTW